MENKRKPRVRLSYKTMYLKSLQEGGKKQAKIIAVPKPPVKNPYGPRELTPVPATQTESNDYVRPQGVLYRPSAEEENKINYDKTRKSYRNQYMITSERIDNLEKRTKAMDNLDEYLMIRITNLEKDLLLFIQKQKTSFKVGAYSWAETLFFISMVGIALITIGNLMNKLWFA